MSIKEAIKETRERKMQELAVKRAEMARLKAEKKSERDLNRFLDQQEKQAVRNGATIYQAKKATVELYEKLNGVYK